MRAMWASVEAPGRSGAPSSSDRAPSRIPPSGKSPMTRPPFSLSIRTAIERLKGGRVIGLFPEGGIRDGARSLLEGAPLRPGASTLAHIARIPILPCVILGSDRLYSKKRWLPLRRTPIWIAFGNPIPHFSELEKSEERARVEHELSAAFQNLYSELQHRF